MNTYTMPRTEKLQDTLQQMDIYYRILDTNVLEVRLFDDNHYMSLLKSLLS